MLDLKFVREHPEEVQKAAQKKGRKIDLEKILALDKEKRQLIVQLEEKRAQRNKIAEVKNPSLSRRKEGIKLKEEIKILEETLRKKTQQLEELLLFLPNIPDQSVPVGENASFNQEVKRWGKIPQFTFLPKDHLTLARELDLVDFERGVKVSGFRGYFLKNEGALLELAVLTYAFQKLVKKGYTPLIAPSLVKEFTLIGSGQFPWGREEVYFLEKDSLYLAGTAEVPVTAYFANEVLSAENLPQKFVAFSPCFRREAGSYGKDTKGLYRLHQFNKVEQVIINRNDTSSSLAFLEELRQNAEEILQDLGLPYRVMLMCTGEMGEPQVKKYDLETWMPSRGDFGETMSDSFLGDFQARRLNLRYREKGKVFFCHTLNNTAVASPRILIPLLENYQREDGSVVIPKVLQAFVGREKIFPKKKKS